MRSAFASLRENVRARVATARPAAGLVVAGICLSVLLAASAGALDNPHIPIGPGGGTVDPPPQPTPPPAWSSPGLSLASRGSGTISLSWCDGSSQDTGNYLWRTTNPEAPSLGDVAAAGGSIVANLPASPNGCHTITDGSVLANPGPPIGKAQSLDSAQSVGSILNGTLTPDTLYCYQVIPHDQFSEYWDYRSSVVCSYTHERPSRSVWRAQLALRTSHGSSDGTDDPVNVTLNRRYLGALYEYLAGYEQPLGNMTKLDRPGDDHERGDVEIYDLNLDAIGDMGDITEISIEKDGDDDWCLDGVSLVINDETLVDKSFSPCKRSGGDSVLYISHDELRAFPAWSTYRSDLVPSDAATRLLNGETVQIMEISRGDLEKRIEGIVGDAISGTSLEWGSLEGSAYVEETPVDTETAHVDLDLEADVTGPNPSVDIDFDLHFAMACDGTGIDFTIDTPPGTFKVKADASIVSYVLSGLFCSGADQFFGEDCPVGVEGAIESQIRTKFTPIANVIRFDLGQAGAACGSIFKPVARITPAGALVIEVQSLVSPPGPTPRPTPKPTPAPTPSAAPTVGVVTKSLRLTDDPTPPINVNQRQITFQAAPGTGPSVVVAPGFGSIGDPTVLGAELFVYQVGGDPADVARIALPAAGWQRTGTAASPGYKYVDAHGSAGPISKVDLGRGVLTIKGRGNHLYALAGAPQGQMAVRLRAGHGATWCATALAKPPLASNDSTAKFVGVANSPAPLTCPHVPGVAGSASRAFVSPPANLLE